MLNILKKLSVLQWIRNPYKKVVNASPFWSGFMKVYSQMGSRLTWHIGDGSLVYVGIDPFIGGENFFQLSSHLIHELHSTDHFRLSRCRIYKLHNPVGSLRWSQGSLMSWIQNGFVILPVLIDLVSYWWTIQTDLCGIGTTWMDKLVPNWDTKPLHFQRCISQGSGGLKICGNSTYH